jgi:1,4-alpha-glucan branching enzyme
MVCSPGTVPDFSPRLSSDDLYLFGEGTHYHLYRKLGAHPSSESGVSGTRFAVWAPNATRVVVVGDFNGWQAGGAALEPVGCSGIWEGFVAGIGRGALYKYHIESRYDPHRVSKADPFGFHHETPPRTASVVWDLEYEWGDAAWMQQRGARFGYDAPMAIYEVHLGSWMRGPDNRWLTYREIAPRLADHVARLGFTHVELMPVMEHPFYGSWGYQITGYFAPTSRFGTPQDLMFLIDHLHQRGIGVIFDWVPGHTPTDEHGLARFDGTHLYEHADPRKGFHPDWTSLIFNYGRNEVRSFLISNGFFWLDKYHADGLRVDGVASMLYLDYSRAPGEWIPNEYGGNENHEAVRFLQQFNEAVYQFFPDVHTVAEESTAWPGVSRPTDAGGLGFGYKWDLGWMHDTLKYLARDCIHRGHHHHEITFRALYAASENYILPLSHDEVVHGKGSLLAKMPGDDWQRFANLRLLYGYMFAQTGKKLLFMGDEFGVRDEWHHEGSLDWSLREQPLHAGLERWVIDLMGAYRSEPALYRRDATGNGFAWLEAGDRAHSVLAFLRLGEPGDPEVAAIFNFTPIPREDYRLGLPEPGLWTERLNSDAEIYGGSGRGNLGAVVADGPPWHGRPHSALVHLPPLGCVFLVGPAKGSR